MNRNTLLLFGSAFMMLMACSTPSSDIKLETLYVAGSEEWRVYSCDICDTEFASHNWPNIKRGMAYNITVFRRDTGLPPSETAELMTNCDGVVQVGKCVEEIIRKSGEPIYSQTIQK